MAEDASSVHLIGYAVQGDLPGLQSFLSFAGPDVTAASKELRGLFRLSVDGREFDVLVAEGPDVDGSRIDLFVSSVAVPVASHSLTRPTSLDLSGRVILRTYSFGDVLAIINAESEGHEPTVVLAAGTGYSESGSAYPVFETDVSSD
jgi:hypothetical protein